jgi:ferredoxin-type protein NapF
MRLHPTLIRLWLFANNRTLHTFTHMNLRFSRARSSKQSPIDRAQFLRVNWRGVADIMPPPWALKEDAFLKACTQCTECITACPENILRVGNKGYPQVDFQRGECTFCGDCERSCEPHALLDDGRSAWSYRAQINNQCLALKRVMCRTCADCCDARAISFQLAVGGFASPEINLNNCTGCGACIAPCPTGSIEITKYQPEN